MENDTSKPRVRAFRYTYRTVMDYLRFRSCSSGKSVFLEWWFCWQFRPEGGMKKITYFCFLILLPPLLSSPRSSSSFYLPSFPSFLSFLFSSHFPISTSLSLFRILSLFSTFVLRLYLHFPSSATWWSEAVTLGSQISRRRGKSKTFLLTVFFATYYNSKLGREHITYQESGKWCFHIYKRKLKFIWDLKLVCHIIYKGLANHFGKKPLNMWSFEKYSMISYALANTFFLYYVVRGLDLWSGFVDAEVA